MNLQQLTLLQTKYKFKRGQITDKAKVRLEEK